MICGSAHSLEHLHVDRGAAPRGPAALRGADHLRRRVAVRCRRPAHPADRPALSLAGSPAPLESLYAVVPGSAMEDLTRGDTGDEEIDQGVTSLDYVGYAGTPCPQVRPSGLRCPPTPLVRSTGGCPAARQLPRSGAGSRCVACDRPGRALCHGLRGRPAMPEAFPAWPTPSPAGLAFPWAPVHRTPTRCGRWWWRTRSAGCSRSGGRWADCSPKRPPPLPTRATVVLVPVPSRRTARARGHDPTYTMSAAAARHLRAVGYDAVPHPVARPAAAWWTRPASTRATRDNLAGSCCARPRPSRLAGGGNGPDVICDDVLTTGATAREAQRALESVGIRSDAIAVVAATPQTGPPSTNRDSSGPRLSSPGDTTNVFVWSPSGSVVARASIHRTWVQPRQADASRRRNGPRKASPGLGRGSRSRCGLVVSPAPSPRQIRRGGRRPIVAEAAKASAGDCGVEDQVGRADSYRTHR